MDKRRLIALAVLFSILSVATVYYLFDRMILRRTELSLSRYTDQKFISLMESLIRENVFKIAGNKIVIDEIALAEQVSNKRLAERARKNIAQLYVKNGEIIFDHRSASIANLRDTGRNILRGMFLDRNGVILARSKLDEKTWTIRREYLHGPECYPLIGHYNIIYGRRNLEDHLNKYLEGSSLGPIYRPTSDPFRKLKIGDDVHLTIDAQLQKTVYDIMNGQKGALVILDVQTGEILAAVSTPSFDPNTRSAAVWRRAFLDNTEKAYDNRAFSTLYPPGSTFKTIVASAWLESIQQEKEGTGQQIICTGRKNRFGISDIYPHGKVGLASAFAHSCNQFFSEIGVILGKELQIQAEAFGFNTQVNLLPRLKGVRYSAEMSLAFSWRNYQKRRPDATNEGIHKNLETYSETDFRHNPKIVAQGAIGQNLITATPLQMAMVAAAIANKGTIMNPFIVKRIKDGKGKSLFDGRPTKMGRAVKKQTAATVARLMEQVMQKGTGEKVKKLYFENGRYVTLPAGKSVRTKSQTKLREIRIAGKTGTAEVGDRNGNGVIDLDEKPHSWFIGFAPASAPRVAIAVVAENQGLGNLTAAPMAVDALAEALNCLGNHRK